MSSGGSGPSGTTKFEWNESLAPYWQRALSESEKAMQPYSQYDGNKVASLNPDITTGQDMVRNYAMNPQDYLYGAGNMHYQSTLAGDYLKGPDANPYAKENPYGGMDSPYFNTMVGKGMDQITEKYKNATEPQLRAQAVMNGTLGGGDYQRVMESSRETLGKQLSDYGAQMENDQYNRSAALWDSYAGRGSGAFENERQRMMQAGAASQADQGLTLDRARAMYESGNINYGQDQKVLDDQYQTWFDKQNFGKNNIGWWTSVLSAAQGGLPPTQLTASRMGSTAAATNGLGAALGAYGLFRS